MNQNWFSVFCKGDWCTIGKVGAAVAGAAIAVAGAEIAVAGIAGDKKCVIGAAGAAVGYGFHNAASNCEKPTGC